VNRPPVPTWLPTLQRRNFPHSKGMSCFPGTNPNYEYPRPHGVDSPFSPADASGRQGGPRLPYPRGALVRPPTPSTIAMSAYVPYCRTAPPTPPPQNLSVSAKKVSSNLQLRDDPDCPCCSHKALPPSIPKNGLPWFRVSFATAVVEGCLSSGPIPSPGLWKMFCTICL